MDLPAAFLTTPIAHRALHDKTQGAPENSLAAIRRAVQAGYGIEVDLQLAADGVAMVFHDYDLDRLTGASGLVRDRTSAELGTIPLLGSDEPIPTLAEMLALVDGRVPLLIELKDQSGGLGQAETALEEAVARDLSGYGGPAAVMSFNPYMVAALSRLAPDIPRGLVTSGFATEKWPDVPPEICAELRAISGYEMSGSSFISHDWRDLDSPRVAELKAQGVPILCWTVTSPEIEAQARQAADNITFEAYMAPRTPK